MSVFSMRFFGSSRGKFCVLCLGKCWWSIELAACHKCGRSWGSYSFRVVSVLCSATCLWSCHLRLHLFKLHREGNLCFDGMGEAGQLWLLGIQVRTQANRSLQTCTCIARKLASQGALLSCDCLSFVIQNKTPLPAIPKTSYELQMWHCTPVFLLLSVSLWFGQ